MQVNVSKVKRGELFRNEEEEEVEEEAVPRGDFRFGTCHISYHSSMTSDCCARRGNGWNRPAAGLEGEATVWLSRRENPQTQAREPNTGTLPPPPHQSETASSQARLITSSPQHSHPGPDVD
ncbi:Atp-Binding Cassette Sub-Family B Member 9 [Manis pentadactyla]|nr:Atp-Binding Cassette Sub-Family B Member 9 [Manis pentadactyla]